SRDVLLQGNGNESAFVASERLRILRVEVKVGRYAFRILQGLSGGYARLQAANQSDDVAPVALVVKAQRREQIHFGAGRKNSTEIERGGQDSDHGNLRAPQGERLAHDVGVGIELATPIGIGEERHRVRIAATLLWSEQAAFRRLDAEYLEKIGDDVDASRGQRVTASGQPEIVGSTERLISSDALVG